MSRREKFRERYKVVEPMFTIAFVDMKPHVLKKSDKGSSSLSLNVKM
jgi:hypothetical protein